MTVRRANAVPNLAGLASQVPANSNTPAAERHGSLVATSELPHLLPDRYVSTPAESVVAQAAQRLVEDNVANTPSTKTPIELRADLAQPSHAPVVKRIVARVCGSVRTGYARWVYNPALMFGRSVLKTTAEFRDAYFGTTPTAYMWKVRALQNLREKGAFGSAYGHEVPDGTPIVLSKLVPTRANLQGGLATQVSEIGHDMQLPDGTLVPITKAKQSLMIGTSGMSFPQLSARSVLTLVFVNAALAEKGVHYLVNTGEGGPEMHLALLTGNREDLRRLVVGWGLKTGELKEGSIDHARIEAFIEQLMDERDKMFATLGPDAVKKAQITAQFGSAFNGIHDAEGNIDFAKLQRVGEQPNVAMIEFKLKQAAKRGSKVDAKKMDQIAAAIREQHAGEKAKSPALNPEIDSYEDIATLVVATRMATRKPVSLKFAVGDVENIAEFLEYLAGMGALPDQIQIDGAGKSISPGSGNAPPTGAGGDSSRTARGALIAIDATLKHLGVRDNVFVQVAGEVMLPTESLEAMALGADSTLGARTWLVMGLGCKGARHCDTGACPYGVTSKQGSVFSDAVDPLAAGPKAVAAALDWRSHLVIEMTESGSVDWRSFRKTHGLHAEKDVLAIREKGRDVPLRSYYDRDYVHQILRGALRPGEIDKAIYRYRPDEYIEQEMFDAERRALNYLDGILSRDPQLVGDVEAFKTERIAALRTHVAAGASHLDVRDFIRAGIPVHLRMPVPAALRSVGLS